MQGPTSPDERQGINGYDFIFGEQLVKECDGLLVVFAIGRL